MFTLWNWTTHLYPMVPLAWSLRAAGHEVVVATQPGLVPEVRRTGLPVVAVGADVETAAMMGQYVQRARRHDAQLVEWAQLRRFGPRNCWLGVAAAEAMTGGLHDFARAWRPDLVVFEATTYAGPIVARLLGVPALRHTWGIDYACLTREFEDEALAELCARWDLPGVEPLGAATVDPCPPSVQVTAGGPVPGVPEVHRLPMRYVPYNGPGKLPGWLTEPRRGPRICVTWGVSNGRFDQELVVTGRVVEALAGLGAEVLAAVPAAEGDRIKAVAPNVRVVRGLPFHALLPTCDAVVSQGGLGTLLTAVAAGVPQVVVPQRADLILNARQLAAAGAADFVLPGDGFEELLTGRVAAVLAGSLDEGTRKLSAELHELPTPNQIAARLVLREATSTAA
ncbi:nucleotide disphospho-sugar-binding domain-containing protein [Amycolatopsis sp. PS_44_ISF1]|uniref:nucleotide disphospho-sugar-binding domain-containing protein n=1 Tax=Amycolatopsis sp. PS_44_ISF1 TaxID=2974917 RepID=UPI0028DD7901|nr:nucleotide disphospho-sugar-binding domain-containing protein [Amycolatopsis sp. PS_44_ISF1]MDT8910084.1 DUF1205 domain-containing protein [Amycolatopsis sp. PS_44_ISF1]